MIAFLIADVALVALLAGPIGVRLSLWSPLAALGWLLSSAVLALIALIWALVAGWRGGNWRFSAVSIVIALVILSVPALQVLGARGAPPIHDISTDLDDPPRFNALIPLRGANASPADYDGAAAAAQQRAAFGDIRPLDLPTPPSAAFERALGSARDLGWTVVASDPATGVIEATDTTRWFRFTDDIVVRVRAAGAGARIDVRSKSRVGQGDLGVNARRIRAFVQRVREQDTPRN